MKGTHYFLDPAQLFTSVWLSVGGVLWITTYILIIRKSFKDRAYGIPLFAICLNITWESLVLAACVPSGDVLGLCPKPDPVGIMRIAEVAGVLVDVFWFSLDCILLYQLFRFGRRTERVRQLRDHWVRYLLVTLVLSLLVQHGFALFYDDMFFIQDAWIINMIMSASFLFLYFDREAHGLAGLSWPAAWTKLGGNLMYAVGLILVHAHSTGSPLVDDDSGSFMLVLFGSTLLFDVIYIRLMHGGRRRLAAGQLAPANAEVAA